MRKIACVVGLLALSGVLGGCAALLGGEHYVMTYSVETTTDTSLQSDGFTFNATISGR